MSLQERMEEYVRAAFSGVWIVSHEKNEAIREIAELCQRDSWQLATWNLAGGIRVGGQSVADEATDPLSAIRAVSALASNEQPTLVVLENFHHFLQSPEIIQAVASQIQLGKQTRTVLVVVSPVVRIPIELEKLFVVVDHELPSREQLCAIAHEVATEAGELPEGDDLERVLDASTGLTRYEAENAFALSLVRKSVLDVETLWQQKAQMLAKSGTLNLYEGDASFDALGGLASLKAFSRRALMGRPSGNVLARGVMLLSPPGCGKSQFCKALGAEVGRPVLQMDVGALMGSLVGQSEERIRHALATVDAMAPCILMIDEVEKAFAGVGGSGSNDSGVSARLFGTLLSWLNDHQSDVFVVCTSNDASKLPPEFARSERFDATFFIDLPARKEKDAIWSMYLGQFNLESAQKRPADKGWTGAEIRSCCRLAALLDVPIVQSARNVVPVSATAAEAIGNLRKWASGRCLDADLGGTFQVAKTRRSTRRSVTRAEPSDN